MVLFTYYVDKLVVANALILFLCAYLVAVEFYMPSIETYEEAVSLTMVKEWINLKSMRLTMKTL